MKLTQYGINFFKEGHQRSINAKKNIAFSILIKGLSIGINLALIPLTINYINPSQYGIWLTLSSILGWFSFFDIGFGNGLRNKFTEAKAKGNLNLARIYISTTYASLIAIFTLVWFFFFLINFFVDWSKLLNAPPQMAIELSKLAIIVFSLFCLQIVFKTISTVIIADQKPAKAAFLEMLGQLLVLLGILILIHNSKGSLISLGIVLGFSPLLILLISSIWLYSCQYKDVAPSFSHIHLFYAKDILSIGIKFFFIQIAVIVIYQTNNIIIAQISSPVDVTIFNIAYKYMSVILMIFSIIISPYWTAITEAYALGDYPWIKNSVKKLRLISYLLIFGVVFLFAVSRFAYQLWIGNIIHIPITITGIIGIYTILLCLVTLNTQILNGTGKITLQLMTYSLGALLHIPLAIFLGKRFGTEGVVMSAIFFCAIIAIISIIQVNRLLEQRAYGIWNK
jgi:O-antigen/teichoic acid export membrane protein